MAKAKRVKKCTCCGEEKEYSCFYKSQSSMYKHDEKCPICKDCCQKIYDENLSFYKSEEKALYRTLFSLDYYFDPKLSKRCLIDIFNTDKNLLRTYMSSINLVQYRGKTSKDSPPMPSLWDIPEEEFQSYKLEDVRMKEPILITKEIINRWGENRSNEDYLFLQEEYENMCATYGNKNFYSLGSYQQIALYKLQLRKEWMKSNPNSKVINDINASISKIAGDCKMKEAQVDNSDEDNMRFSKFIEMIEETEPIPKDEKFDDYDDIHKVWLEDFVKPFAIAQGLESNEHYLKMKYEGKITKGDEDERNSN